MNEIQPTPVLMNILYACANARLPWGVDWDPFVVLCDGDGSPARYILCCGHSLDLARSARLIGAGLLLPGPNDQFGRRTLTVTQQGRSFLAEHLDMVEFEDG